MTKGLAAAVLGLTLALAACGGGEEPSTTTEPTMPTPPARATPTPTVTVTPGAAESLGVIDGVEVVPLEVGDEIELPDDVALIVEVGCTQCDGPTEGLLRVYRDASGQVRTDSLFERIEGESFISSFALNSDASDIVIAVCSRCELLGPPTPDAQTTLFRSLDGGVTWAEFGVFDGQYFVHAIAKDGVLLQVPDDMEVALGEKEFGYQLFPSGDPVEPPVQAGGRLPVSLLDGELIWPTDDGRLLQNDGSELLALGSGAEFLWFTPGIPLGPTHERFTVVWSRSSVDDYFLGVASLDGHLIKTYRMAGYASVGGWLGPHRAVGNAYFSGEELDAILPDSYAGRELLIQSGRNWPALLDLDAGRVYPISNPFVAPAFETGRNFVQAVVHGPFARVVETGSCLNVRAEPGTAAAILDCMADGVLLRDTRVAAEIDGETWLRVVTPGGLEGWASTTYLER